MQGDGINRREFLGKGAAVGLGVLSHPGFSGRVFGANDRLVMGLIGAGGRGRGVMQEFIQQGLPAGSRPPAPGNSSPARTLTRCSLPPPSTGTTAS